MKAIQPKPGIADEKALYLSPPVIKDIAVPVRVEPLPHVRVFIGIGPIKKI
jgi:hypothetical protein